MRRSLVFVGLVALSALIAWLGGYDFDERTLDVAVAAAMVVFYSWLFAYHFD